jgi:hypothetical protein
VVEIPATENKDKILIPKIDGEINKSPLRLRDQKANPARTEKGKNR